MSNSAWLHHERSDPKNTNEILTVIGPYIRGLTECFNIISFQDSSYSRTYLKSMICCEIKLICCYSVIELTLQTELSGKLGVLYRVKVSRLCTTVRSVILYRYTKWTVLICLHLLVPIYMHIISEYMLQGCCCGRKYVNSVNNNVRQRKQISRFRYVRHFD